VTGILDPVTSFILIQIIGLAVGEQQQQATAL